MTGRQLRNARKELGWSQSVAAREFGVTPRTWSRWEHGAVALPEMAAKLMGFYLRERKR